MNTHKFKADPYNFSNKLVTTSDVIDILKNVNMNTNKNKNRNSETTFGL